MEPIQNTGVVDYSALAAAQNQAQPAEVAEDYSSMPMVYEPEIEEKKNASSNMIGLTALGVAAAVGMGIGIYKHRQVGKLKAEVDSLTNKNVDLTKQLDEANAKIKDMEPKSIKERVKNWWNNLWNKDGKNSVDKAAEGEKPKTTEKPEKPEK